MLASLLSAAVAFALPMQSGVWTNVSGSLGGPTWANSGVAFVTTIPGTSSILASVNKSGLWRSDDLGATWRQLEGSVPITHMTTQIRFDPKSNDIFWVAGMYGPGVFKTKDGGRTFERLGGTLNHTDGLAVDFFDEFRRTIIVGIHERHREMMSSVSSGISWKPFGSNMPGNAGHYHIVDILAEDVVIIPSTMQKAEGVFRSPDLGKSWQKVADFKATGPGVISKDNVYILPVSGGIARTADTGKTWQFSAGPNFRQIEVLKDGSILGLEDTTLQMSRDGGVTWKPFGPKLPYRPFGFTFVYDKQALFIYSIAGPKSSTSLLRWRQN